MGCKIVFTKLAVGDLERLVSFIAKDNPQAAEKFGDSVIQKVESLNEFPFFGRVVPEFRIENIREIIHRPFRIVYRVDEERKLIEILRIWHAARGIPRIHE